MHFSIFHILLAVLFQAEWTKSKNILAVFSHLGKSHFAMYEPYVQRLAERGHAVTLVTWFNVTNLHENIEGISFGDESESFEVNLKEYEATPRFFMGLYELSHLNRFGQKACSSALANPKIKELIKSKKKFDLVVAEYFNTDCFAVFAHIFNAPLAGIFSSAPMPWHNDRMGNPDNPSYVLNMFSGHPSHMNFFARLKNAVALFFYKSYYKMFYVGPTDKIIRAHLGRGIPKISDIVTNTSVFLINSHHSLLQPRPLAPGTVEVGGLHVAHPKKLPPDLQKYLDGSANGVVYFSFGTVVEETSIPAKKLNSIMGAFENLTQNVLWKWKGEEMPGKSKNVRIRKWLPQNDVLGHPNVKVFINHGGLMGIMEAVTHGVPMIIIPLFGDQFHNAAMITEKGSAITLDYFALTKDKLLSALKTVLEDNRYRENAKRLAVKFKERPLSAMNNAIYWTEYVLKFKGTPHLKPSNTKLTWFSECLLDVLLFVAAITILCVFLGKKAVIAYAEIQKVRKARERKKK